MATEKHIETIARGVCVRDGKVMLCYPKNRSYAYLPGGHIEFGETGREALVREMKEETGLDATAGELLGVIESSFVQNGEKHCEINLVYEMKVEETKFDELKSMEDWICFDWVDCNRLAGERLLPEAAAEFCVSEHRPLQG